jgi:hypothetical protein
MAFFLASSLLYGEIGDSVIYGIFEYSTVEKADIDTIHEHIFRFMDEYDNNLKRRYFRNDSNIRFFIKNYSSQMGYSLEYNTELKIMTFYKRQFFSLQKDFNIEITFTFTYFPSFEDDGITERYVYDFIAITVHNILNQFIEYMSNNNIRLIMTGKHPLE